MIFNMNDCIWRLEIVDPDCEKLIDRTGQLCVATTDPITRTVYLSRRLQGDQLRTVLLHELGHVAMISYEMLGEVHQMSNPRYWIDMEEWICNFVADIGPFIFQTAKSILD